MINRAEKYRNFKKIIKFNKIFIKTYRHSFKTGARLRVEKIVAEITWKASYEANYLKCYLQYKSSYYSR